MKAKSYLFFIVVLMTVFTAGCGTSPLRQQLVDIDSLIYKDQDTMAFRALVSIAQDELLNRSDRAYYNLLKMQICYRMYKEMPDSVIDDCVGYYENGWDKEKLATAYLYRGAYYKDSVRVKEAVTYFKRTEELIPYMKNKKLVIILYNHLYFLNIEGFDETRALRYAHSELALANEVNDKFWKLYALIDIANAYKRLGIRDSALLYANQALSYIGCGRKDADAASYRIIGEVMVDQEPEYAQQMLEKSLAVWPNAFAYKALSRIYQREGDMGKTREMWNAALSRSDMSVKTEVLQIMREQEQREGHWQKAAFLADWQLGLKDSLQRQQESWRIAQLQTDYDQQLHVNELREQRRQAWLAGGIMLLAVALLLLYLRYKTVKQRDELAKATQLMANYKSRIAELEHEWQQMETESQQAAYAATIAQLKARMDELEHRHADVLSKGKTLYEGLKEGKTMVTWKKADFAHFMAYYRLVDYNFVMTLESDYEGLSVKYATFAVLQHVGYDDRQIEHIMGISPNTVRAIRSRIRSRRVEE